MSKPYIISFGEINSQIESFPQKDFIVDYLASHGCKTILVELNYIDKDYLVDYSKFFARSYEKISRRVKRVHFFSFEFTQKAFEDALGYLGDYAQLIVYDDLLKSLKEEYIGCIILKPLLNNHGQKLIGRTLLKHPDVSGSNIFEKSRFIYKNNNVNLFGIPLDVSSLPFQMQDTVVGGCATSALWIANSKLNDLFNTPKLSPFEVTETAVELIETNRNFPSQGLTVEQMLNFLKSIKLDYDVVNLGNLKSIIKNREFSDDILNEAERNLRCLVPDTIKGFASAEIPIICGIRLYKFDPDGLLVRKPFHAVVVSGYKQNESGEICEIYVHDDQIGPYGIVKSESSDLSFLEWDCEWTRSGEYDKVEIEIIIIPIYHKMRIIYNHIHQMLQDNRRDFPKLSFDLYLTNIQKYKSEVLPLQFDNKLNFLKKSLPRFVWVLCSYDSLGDPISDMLFDATSHNIRCIEEIFFKC